MFYQFNDAEGKVCPGAPERKKKEPRTNLTPLPLSHESKGNFLSRKLDAIEANVLASELEKTSLTSMKPNK